LRTAFPWRRIPSNGARSRRPSHSRRAAIEAVATFDHPFTINELLPRGNFTQGEATLA